MTSPGYPIRIVIEHEATGERREWAMTERHLKLILRALRVHKAVPAFLAERFDFAPRRRRRRYFIGGVPQRRR